MLRDPGVWSVEDASELYEVARWGMGYFSIADDGHLRVHPHRDERRSIDLKKLVEQLELRGLALPILIRFNDILNDRLREIAGAFDKAISDHAYGGGYRCVYPIKVNQQRQVVEKIVGYGREFGFGLEAGSKPELFAVIAVTDNETPIVCNGFKDAEFVEAAMLAAKMGRRVLVVIEKFTELELVLNGATRLDVRPTIGIRVKLAARGSGRWEASGGYRSKFGLTVTELLKALELLKGREMQDCLQLLHFHLGSQVTNIRHIKSALVEAAQVYANLHKQGAGLRILNVGGGLGVDYDGSQTNFTSSVNYTLQEYANDVVYHIANVCDAAEVPHPDIVSESGRAVVAYHSVLVFNVLGVSGFVDAEMPRGEQSAPEAQPLQTLQETYAAIRLDNLQESYHDALQAFDMAINLFSVGHLSLEERALAENLFWNICRRIRELVDELEFPPEELDGLDELLCETYFCNFSLFQSLPDSWAIDQLFPVMPIHRLDEKPTRQAVLGDITCDSDGKIDSFIDRRSTRNTLPLHAMDDAPYHLAAFLVGAYQEILGDLHNLFGDTNAVHVALDSSGEVKLETVVKGDTVGQVLSYVQFDDRDLVSRMQAAVELAVKQKRLDNREAGKLLKFYEEGLGGYTYLGEPPEV